jgi:hypothetical protein
MGQIKARVHDQTRQLSPAALRAKYSGFHALSLDIRKVGEPERTRPDLGRVLIYRPDWSSAFQDKADIRKCDGNVR